ncbi:MAG: adenylate kinase [Chloroflexota bacterium]
MNNFTFQRIAVVGTTSSGKSTLAQKLAQKIGADYIELDALFWEPNWTPAQSADFFVRVEDAIQSDAWVTAGNYRLVRDLIWDRAQAVIWLDYSFPLIFWRLLMRTIRRAVTQEELWSGNRESFWGHLKIWSEESLFHWLFKTYWRRKREYPTLFAEPGNTHLTVFHFKSPREADKWLEAVADPLRKIFTTKDTMVTKEKAL